MAALTGSLMVEAGLATEELETELLLEALFQRFGYDFSGATSGPRCGVPFHIGRKKRRSRGSGNPC